MKVSFINLLNIIVISTKFIWLEAATEVLCTKRCSVESTKSIKIKMTHRRAVGNGCIWEKISLMNTCCVSQSVFYQVLNAVSDGAFKRN